MEKTHHQIIRRPKERNREKATSNQRKDQNKEGDILLINSIWKRKDIEGTQKELYFDGSLLIEGEISNTSFLFGIVLLF